MSNVDQSKGNRELVSNLEESVAGILRERNLEKVNQNSEPVCYRETFYAKYVKRILDLFIAIPVLVVTLPLNIIFGIITFFDVGRPVIFRQTRTGKNGKSFEMIKFRNMNENKDNDGKLLPPSQRVTGFGRFMRKYSLDELLNFVSVLKGDMSIIGPRPMPLFIEERMSDRHRGREFVKPGIECPRVVKIDRSIAGSWQEEFENAVWYVEHISFITDVKMVILLIKMTLNFKERSKNAGGLGYFVGYDDFGHATSLNRLKMDFPNEEFLNFKKCD